MLSGFCRKYFIISILSVLVYIMLFHIFISPIVTPLSHTDYVFLRIIPRTLEINAIFIAPTLIIKKLSITEKEAFNKILAKTSIFILIISLVFIHVITDNFFNERWNLFGAWAAIVLLFLFFIVITSICFICVLLYRRIKCVNEQLTTMFLPILKNISLYFYVSLIVISFYIFVGT